MVPAYAAGPSLLRATPTGGSYAPTSLLHRRRGGLVTTTRFSSFSSSDRATIPKKNKKNQQPPRAVPSDDDAAAADADDDAFDLSTLAKRMEALKRQEETGSTATIQVVVLDATLPGMDRSVSHNSPSLDSFCSLPFSHPPPHTRTHR